MKPEKRVIEAVEKAQGLLAHCDNTINELMDILDNERLVEAVREVTDEALSLRRPAQEKPKGGQET